MRQIKFSLTVLLLFLILAIVGLTHAQTSYVIQPGDTLYSIARRFGTSVSAIAAANNIVNPNLIFAGQSLIIPGDDAGGADDSATPPQPPAPPPPPTTGTTYVVQRGDTLTRIAVRHSVSVQAIAQANGLANPNLIFAGQSLIIPGSSPAPPSTSDPPPPSSTPLPQPSPVPPPTEIPPPTQAPPPTPEPVPTSSIPIGVNLLRNPSFEEGWYHPNNIPELQIPNQWIFEWDEGHNPLDSASWNRFIRPEVRVLSESFLPPAEQPIFIWDGVHTVKVFKGGGALSFRLLSDIYLEPGTYRLTINVFPDLVEGYTSSGGKVWASDPLSGEVSFFVGAPTGNWILPTFGQRNTLQHTFNITSAGIVRLGGAFRGRWAIQNNGWFTDAWSLQRIGD